MSAFRIRLATENDLDAVRAIFNYYVTHSTCTFQIALDTADKRLAWFLGRAERHPVTVAEAGGAIIGWAALSPWMSRCGYVNSVEASVYVHHAHHRRGVGKGLLLDLIARARATGLHTIIGGTTTDQAASLGLQVALGFEPVGTFRQVGYKFDRWLDVTYMQLLLNSPSVSACPEQTA